MSRDIDLYQQPELLESITVISLAEAAAPAESFVWMMAEKAVGEISRRIDVMGLPLQAPELLKMRSLRPSLKKLMASAARVAVIAGLRIDEVETPVIHHALRRSGQIIHPPGAAFGANQPVTDQNLLDQTPFSRQPPKPWTGNEATPLINPLIAGGEATTMPVWLEDDLPAGGFDFLGIPLPAAESSDWLLPQLGAQFPVVTQALTDILWPMIHDLAPPGADESVG